ncbi:MAG: hypothetical protein V1761_00155 [bacterium]
MYRLIVDGIVNPRNLIKYRNKSGWYVLAFFLILSLFISIGTIVFLVGYQPAVPFEASSTGCAYESGSLVCTDPDIAYDEPFDFYGIKTFFLNADDEVSALDISIGSALVFQEHFIGFFDNGKSLMTLDLAEELANGLTLDIMMQTLQRWYAIVAILVSILFNVVVLAFFTAMASISVMRLRNYIRYGMAFKILAFAATPFAIVLTFHNLLHFNDIILMALMVLSFRSAFLVIRELFEQAYAYMNPSQPEGPSAEDTSKPDADDGSDDDR